eukprot:COSAG06_NODE_38069_length_427_cov_41.774390_2_plen_73_part_01
MSLSNTQTLLSKIELDFQKAYRHHNPRWNVDAVFVRISTVRVTDLDVKQTEVRFARYWLSVTARFPLRAREPI